MMRLCGALLGYASCAGAFSYPSIPQHRRLFELQTHGGRSCTLRNRRCATLKAEANNKLRGGRQGSTSDGRKPNKREDVVQRPNTNGRSSLQKKKNTDTSAASAIDKQNRSSKSTKNNIIAEATAAAAPLVQQGAEAAVDILANTDAVYAMLKPLHDWSASRSRVSAAVKAERRSIAAAEATRKQQESATAWWSLLLPQALAQPLEDAYNAVLSAAAAPARLAAGVEKTAQDISAAPEKIARMAEDVVAAGTKTVETLASVPRRAREAAEAGVELRASVEKVLEDGKEAYDSWCAAAKYFPEESQRAVGAGVRSLAKASEAMETLPTRLPDLIENASDEAQLLAGDLAKRTADGMNAAGSALWTAAVDLGGSAAEQVLQQTLAPIHAYWTSVSRVQAALEKEQAALPPPSPSTKAANAEGVQTALTLDKDMGRPDLQEGTALPSAGAATPDTDAMGGSSLGLRGKFAAWRRNRRSRSTAAAELRDAGVSSSRNSRRNNNSGNGDGTAVLEPQLMPTVAVVAGVAKGMVGETAAVDADEVAAVVLDGAEGRLESSFMEGEVEVVARSDVARGFPGRGTGNSDEEGGKATGGEFTRAVAEREGRTVSVEEASPPGGDAEESVGGSPNPLVTVVEEGSIPQRPSVVGGASTMPTEVNAQAGAGRSRPPDSGAAAQEARGDAVREDTAAATSVAEVTLGDLKAEVDAEDDTISVPRATTARVMEVTDARRGQAEAAASRVDGVDSSDASVTFDDTRPGGETGVAAGSIRQKQDPPDGKLAMEPSSTGEAAAAAADIIQPPVLLPSVSRDAAIAELASSSSTPGDVVSSAGAGQLDNKEDGEKRVTAAVVPPSSTGETDTTAVDAQAAVVSGQGESGAVVVTTGPLPGPESSSASRVLDETLPIVIVDGGTTTTDTANVAATTPSLGSRTAPTAVATDETEASAAGPRAQKTTTNAPTLVPPPPATAATGEGAEAMTTATTVVPGLVMGSNSDIASEKTTAALPAAALDVKPAKVEVESSTGANSDSTGVPVAEALLTAGDDVASASASDRQGSGSRGVMSPAADFLREWVEAALPQKKAQLKKSREEALVCWERQWYAVAIASELPRKWLSDGKIVCVQILGRDFELVPRSLSGASAGGGADDDSSEWSCRVPLRAAQSLLKPGAKVPLRESSGLLWVWPDISPEGLATAAALAGPPMLPIFLDREATEEDEEDKAPGPWRRLSRRRSARLRERPWRRRDGRKVVRGRLQCAVVHRELSCGYLDAVRGLLACSHGAAVRAAAAGGAGEVVVVEDMRAGIDGTLASAAGNNAGFHGSFNSSGSQGQVSFTCPTVVEWRFSRPADSWTTAAAPTASHDDCDGKEADVAGPSPRRWLRRRLSGLGGGGGSGRREERKSRRRRAGEWRREGAGDGGLEGDMRYIAVALPVGPERTRMFLRLEMEPLRVAEGRSLWWARVARRAQLVKAIVDIEAAARRNREQGGDARITADGVTRRSSVASSTQQLPSAVEEWLGRAIGGGPF